MLYATTTRVPDATESRPSHRQNLLRLRHGLQHEVLELLLLRNRQERRAACVQGLHAGCTRRVSAVMHGVALNSATRAEAGRKARALAERGTQRSPEPSARRTRARTLLARRTLHGAHAERAPHAQQRLARACLPPCVASCPSGFLPLVESARCAQLPSGVCMF